MSAVTLEGLESRGRLGNQMWQVAACIGIARTLGASVHIPGSWSYRPWFSLPEPFYEPAPAGALVADQWEGLAHIDPRARMYLQDLGLFVRASATVRAAFEPSAAARAVLEDDPAWAMVTAPGSWSLHVRRGDTVTQPKGYQPLATLDYYAAALSRVPVEAPVIVFSDDIAWCRKRLAPILDGRPAHFVDHGAGRSHLIRTYHRQPAMDWVDLQLMAATLGHILSNSTYAWWAAWLGHDVCALYPEVWWGENLAHIDSSLMIPDGWIEVPC